MTPASMTAAQLLYATVDAAHSPRGIDGFQILGYTGALLSPEDARLIEAHCQFSPANAQHSKWQHYLLPDRRAVVTFLRAVAEPDALGRRGRYFAHSLVLDQADWLALGAAPFDLMGRNNFCTSLDDALARTRGDWQDLPALPLDVGTGWEQAAFQQARHWEPAELRRLYSLAQGGAELVAAGTYVALLGDEPSTGAAVAVAFLLCDTAERAACSFDTWSTNCNWRRTTPFWYRGFPGQSEADTRLTVDVATRRVNAGETPALSAYSAWVDGRLAAGDLDGMLRERAAARAGCAWIAGELAAVPWAELSAQLEHELAELHADRLREGLTALAGLTLSPELQGALAEGVGDPVSQLRILRDPPPLEHWDALLIELLIDRLPAPLDPDDQEALAAAGERNPALGLLAALYKGDEALRWRSLQALDPDAYAKTAAAMLASGKPQAWQLFAPRHAEEWQRLCAHGGGEASVMAGLLAVARGEGADASFAALAAALSAAERAELADDLRPALARLQTLVERLEQPDAVPAQRGLFQSLFRRNPEPPRGGKR